MKNKIVFGRWEAIMLTVIGMVTQIFLGFPRATAESAGTAGWIQVIYAAGIVFVLFTIIAKLYASFPGKDLLDISEFIGGNVLRILVGFILLAYFMLIMSLVLREFGEDMKVIALNESPISFVMLFFLIGMIFAAYFGLETILRYASIMVPIIIAGYVIIIIGVSNYYDYTNLLPILGNGLNGIFIKGAVRISSFSALIFVFLIPPYIKTHHNFKIVGYTSLVIGSLLLISSSFVYILVEPYPTSTQDILPIYELARLINFGRFFQRIEAVFVLIWASAAFIYLSFGFFFIVFIFKKTFKLEYFRPIIFPFAILLFTFSLLPESLMRTNELEVSIFRKYAWLVTFIMTILLLIVGKCKKKYLKKGELKGGT